jgi:dihydropteroate synthase
MIGQILKVRDTNLRVIGSVAMALMAAQKGAAILRVHDVLETKQAIDVWQSTLKNRE